MIIGALGFATVVLDATRLQSTFVGQTGSPSDSYTIRTPGAPVVVLAAPTPFVNQTSTTDGATPAPTVTGALFDQIVVVAMENKNQNEVYGPAPYLTQLADQYGFAQNWRSTVNPSQVNYIDVIGGSTWGLSGDGLHPNLNHPTIVDIIENSGHTWKAIAEGSGSGCSINPDRGEDHFPFLSYTTITSNPSRCANLYSGGPTQVINEFNAGTNFIWLTPNDCNNMHSCSVSTGDNYINSWAPQLLTAMAGKRAALVVWFDEAYTSPPYIYVSISGTAVKPAYKSSTEFIHPSLIKLIEDAWGGGNLGQRDVTAASPVEFFTPAGPPPPLSVDFSYVPTQPAITQTVTFTAVPNSGVAPYAFAWTFGDGGSGTGNPATHVYGTATAYTVQVTATDSASTQAVKSKPITVLTEPPPGPITTALTLTTSPNPSQAETPVTVSGRLTGNGAGIPSQAVALQWSWDQGSWSNESQIGQFPPTDTDGAFSGTMVFHGIVDHTEYIRAQFAASGDYLASTSPAVAQAIQLAPVPPPPPSFSTDFIFTPSSAVVGQIVTFTSTTVDGTAPYTFSWNFGDGTAGAGNPATHAYTSAGTYTVQVTASDSAAHTATKSKPAVVSASAPPPPPGSPSAQFTLTPTSPQVDATVTFDASPSTSSNGALEARWDWEDDGLWDTAWSTTLILTHAFSATGTYSVRVEVRDAGGLSDVIAHSVTVVDSQGGGTPGAPTTAVELTGTLGANGWHVSPVNVTLRATSPTGSVTTTMYAVDSESWTTYTGPFTIGEGLHTLKWQSVDGVGSIEPMKSTSVRVDMTPPVLGAPSPSGRLTQTDVTISWRAYDDASGIARYEISVDDAMFESVGMETSVTRHLSNGPHTIEVKAVDQAGHESVAASQVTVEPGTTGFLGPLEGNPLTIPAFALGFLLIGVAAIRRRMFRTQRGGGGQPQAEYDAADRDDAWDM